MARTHRFSCVRRERKEVKRRAGGEGRGRGREGATDRERDRVTGGDHRGVTIDETAEETAEETADATTGGITVGGLGRVPGTFAHRFHCQFSMSASLTVYDRFFRRRSRSGDRRRRRDRSDSADREKYEGDDGERLTATQKVNKNKTEQLGLTTSCPLLSRMSRFAAAANDGEGEIGRRTNARGPGYA